MAIPIVETSSIGFFLLRYGGVPQQLNTCCLIWKNTPHQIFFHPPPSKVNFPNYITIFMS